MKCSRDSIGVGRRRECRPRPVTVVHVGLVLGLALMATACGGSSSETPFPQPPVERSLMQRHRSVFESEAASSPKAEPTDVPMSDAGEQLGQREAVGTTSSQQLLTSPSPSSELPPSR